MRLLYVEDSTRLLKSVTRGLEKSGFAIDTASDGEAGLELALTEPYDVVILDVMLPKLDGLSVLQEIRKAKVDTSVLMLSAKVSTVDRIQGLNLGADDYLVKPFQLEELVARLHALNRRRYGLQGNRILLGNLALDMASQRAFIGNEEVALRPREFEILQYLMCRSGDVVSRTEILEHVYDHAVDLKSNAIDAAVCTTRKKLNDGGARANIRTIPRRGYLIEQADQPADSP